MFTAQFVLGLLYVVSIVLGAFAIGGSVVEYRRVTKKLNK